MRSKGYIRFLNSKSARSVTKHCACAHPCTHAQMHRQSLLEGVTPDGNSFKSNSDVYLNSRKLGDAGSSQTTTLMDPVLGYPYPLVPTFSSPSSHRGYWNSLPLHPCAGHLHLHHKPSQPSSISVHIWAYNVILEALLGTIVFKKIIRATFPAVIGYIRINKFRSDTERNQRVKLVMILNAQIGLSVLLDNTD